MLETKTSVILPPKKCETGKFPDRYGHNGDGFQKQVILRNTLFEDMHEYFSKPGIRLHE
jgi:hypothetical protein